MMTTRRHPLLVIVALGFLALTGACSHTDRAQQQVQHGDNNAPGDTIIVQPDSCVTKDGIPAGAQKLIKAYPEMAISYEDNHIIVNGERIPYDDGKKKSFVELLDNSDVEDMFAMAYDITVPQPAYLSDAGRSRCEALFKAMYGHSEAEVARHLVTVDWFGQKLKFTSINGAHRQLKKVEQELQGNTALRSYFAQSSTFYWRKVRGAKRQSAHSYGMTIDINAASSDYWQWANPRKGELDKISYKNRIPMEIVKAFEKHGFIWGGRWYHFDTMHFEYRPELLP